MKINDNNFQIFITRKRAFFFFLSVLIVLYLLPFIAILIAILIRPSIINNVNTYLLLIIIEIFYTPLEIYVFIRFIRDFYPFYKMSLEINSEKIEIIINGKIFYKELWRNIKKIEIIDEKSFSYQAKHLYKINVVTNNETRGLRLYVLYINIKKGKEIIKTIERIAKSKDIDIESMHQKYIDKYSFMREIDNERWIIKEFTKL